MKYKAAIFDLDGTLLNTIEDLADSLNYALGKFDLPLRTVAEVNSFVGNGIRKLIERGVPQGSSQNTVDKVFEDFNSHYRLHCADKTKPYDGITDLLKCMRQAGIKTAVVSNKADYAVAQLCKKYFDGLLDVAMGEKVGLNRKPAPDMVFAVLSSLSLTAADAVYIGDSDVDIATGKNADMPVISVSWGFRKKEFLIQCGAKLIADTPSDIKSLL